MRKNKERDNNYYKRERENTFSKNHVRVDTVKSHSQIDRGIRVHTVKGTWTGQAWKA